ncbi:MAG TPA: ABC transporter ATP-binding protein [Chloroflexota bacterium]|nr:ABC transporter ATP-binding protein [Chloroflexota bacterium]
MAEKIAPLLHVNGLSAAYGNVTALWDVSFSVAEGQVVALLGSNGAGKTTTLRTLSGLLESTSGTVRFAGQDITHARSDQIVDLGIIHVPEGRQLWPRMSVQENLELGAYAARAKAQRAATLERVYSLFPRLKERRTQAAGTLSGGERQMCALGRGLMGLPRLLMLDEPSLGLAPRLVGEMFETLRVLRQQGLTVLLVEQNVHQALELADAAFVLETGRIVLSGPSAELLADERVRNAYLGVGVG